MRLPGEGGGRRHVSSKEAWWRMKVLPTKLSSRLHFRSRLDSANDRPATLSERDATQQPRCNRDASVMLRQMQTRSSFTDLWPDRHDKYSLMQKNTGKIQARYRQGTDKVQTRNRQDTCRYIHVYACVWILLRNSCTYMHIHTSVSSVRCLNLQVCTSIPFFPKMTIFFPKTKNQEKQPYTLNPRTKNIFLEKKWSFFGKSGFHVCRLRCTFRNIARFRNRKWYLTLHICRVPAGMQKNRPARTALHKETTPLPVPAMSDDDSVSSEPSKHN